MKRVLLTFLVLMAAIVLVGCRNRNLIISDNGKDSLEVYRLYETKNMYNFIRLDTRTGQMKLVQWSIESDKRFTYSLSDRSLIPENDIKVEGRFELYPTTNIYTLILLDKVSGKTWQVQWHFDAENRMVTPIL